MILMHIKKPALERAGPLNDEVKED